MGTSAVPIYINDVWSRHNIFSAEANNEASRRVPSAYTDTCSFMSESLHEVARGFRRCPQLLKLGDKVSGVSSSDA